LGKRGFVGIEYNVKEIETKVPDVFLRRVLCVDLRGCRILSLDSSAQIITELIMKLDP